ncbi:MAG TPA: PilZ domain-containing protein [Gemmatimonadales bacterium]|nr:PilZ domain-containing protein [Gemmatimonadales bacterium]
MTPPISPRRHGRLRYPADHRPSLILEDDELSVIDLSERGLRYRQVHGPEPKVGARFEGILQLIRGETLPVRGTVVRVSRPDGPARPELVEVAAHLTEAGIPSRVIIAERQALQEQ